MLTVVVYDSKFGNTEKVAQAIGRGVSARSQVRVLDTAEATQTLDERPDLLIVGGPTQKRSMSPGLVAYLDRAIAHGIGNLIATAFDTRYHGSTWINGSAARDAAQRLHNAGARLISLPESFFISRSGPLERQGLEPGEIERAERWGAVVIAAAVGNGSPS